jgi:hypothetical protein
VLSPGLSGDSLVVTEGVDVSTVHEVINALGRVGKLSQEVHFHRGRRSLSSLAAEQFECDPLVARGEPGEEPLVSFHVPTSARELPFRRGVVFR